MLKNLTQRRIKIVDKDGHIVKIIDPEPRAADCQIFRDSDILEDGIEVSQYRYLHPIGVPDPEPGVTLIVPYAVLKALKNTRQDVVAPDTSPESVFRDEMTGKVIGVRWLQKL